MAKPENETTADVMDGVPVEPTVPAPTYMNAGVADADRIRVVHADSGRPIRHVLEANSAEGWYVRFVVKNGGFVRTEGGFGDAFETEKVEAAIRLEVINAA